MENTYKRSWALGQAYMLPVYVMPWAALVGIVYGYGPIIVTSEKFQFFLFIISLALALVIPYWAVKKLKVRNTLVIIAAGLLAGFTLWYASWVIFEDQIFKGDENNSIVYLASHPGVMWDKTNYITETETDTGSYSSTKEINNDELLAKWLFEGLIFVLFPALVTWLLMRNEVFCEDCDQWAVALDNFLRLRKPASGDIKEMKNSIGQRGLQGLLGFSSSVAGTHELDYLELDLHQCQKCKMFTTMSVGDVKITVDKKNVAKKKRKGIIKNLLISAHDFAALSKLQKPTA